MKPRFLNRNLWVRVLVASALGVFLSIETIGLRASDDNAVRTANYELASQWTVPKINKLIFDTQVTPHWLEFSDRFWYSYETRDGKRYFIVDPSVAARPGAKAAALKAPLFDHAKMAAMLASATLVPMDAQHLPIKSLKFVNKDTALQLEIEVPKDADIPGLKKKPVTTTNQGGDARDDEAGLSGDPQQRRGVGTAAACRRRSGRRSEEEHRLRVRPRERQARARCPTSNRRRSRCWASVSPDDSTVDLRARPQPLHDGRRQLREGEEEARRRVDRRDAITTDGEEHFGYDKRLNDDDKKALKKDSKGDKNKAGQRVPSIVITGRRIRRSSRWSAAMSARSPSSG